MPAKNPLDVTISILIPCYNWNIVNLIKDLHVLCLKESQLHNFEIICIEDGSSNYFSNHSIKKLENVKYEILQKNIGRSAIRNLLAKKARFEWLLFIDCDSKIATSDFILNYIQSITTSTETKSAYSYIYYGETIYEKKATKNTLHQKYGIKIESNRKKDNFSSHHFLIQKAGFKQNQFNENIKSYGYEDVLFQITHTYHFQYIKNPLYHIGLKTNQHFIKDCESGLKNLLQYSQNKKVIRKIKILRWSSRFGFAIFKIPIMFLFNTFKSSILNNLLSKNPSLFLFQFYKIGFFLQLKYNSRKKRK